MLTLMHNYTKPLDLYTCKFLCQVVHSIVLNIPMCPFYVMYTAKPPQKNSQLTMTSFGIQGNKEPQPIKILFTSK
jgi:hypothetical protein